MGPMPASRQDKLPVRSSYPAPLTKSGPCSQPLVSRRNFGSKGGTFVAKEPLLRQLYYFPQLYFRLNFQPNAIQLTSDCLSP
jgi:hypothetical protein